VKDNAANNNAGKEIRAIWVGEIYRLCLGKTKEKKKKDEGMRLEAVKLLLTQNNLHEGSLNK